MADRHLFVGNLCNITIESLREYCERYGTISDLQLNRDKDKNIYHCFAFLTYQTSLSATQFMQKRPHTINNEEIFVKRALSRFTASIPERLVVTNRLVLSNISKFDKQMVRNYFHKFGRIRTFDYDNGLIDFDDYDDVDRVLLARPHYVGDKIINATKFIPKGPEDIEQNAEEELVDNEVEDYKMKYFLLEKEFENYKQSKEKEMECLRKEIGNLKGDLSDITQIKLDKILKNQHTYHNQLLLNLSSNHGDNVHRQMCDDFLRLSPNKKRKTSITSQDFI